MHTCPEIHSPPTSTKAPRSWISSCSRFRSSTVWLYCVPSAPHVSAAPATAPATAPAPRATPHALAVEALTASATHAQTLRQDHRAAVPDGVPAQVQLDQVPAPPPARHQCVRRLFNPGHAEALDISANPDLRSTRWCSGEGTCSVGTRAQRRSCASRGSCCTPA
jgi:hypothetical protein